MFDSLTRSEASAMVLIVLGIAAVLASRFSNYPIRIGNEGDDEDDRILDPRQATILGMLLVVSGALVLFVPWAGWAVAVAAFGWSWRVAR